MCVNNVIKAVNKCQTTFLFISKFRCYNNRQLPPTPPHPWGGTPYKNDGDASQKCSKKHRKKYQNLVR